MRRAVITNRARLTTTSVPPATCHASTRSSSNTNAQPTARAGVQCHHRPVAADADPETVPADDIGDVGAEVVTSSPVGFGDIGRVDIPQDNASRRHGGHVVVERAGVKMYDGRDVSN